MSVASRDLTSLGVVAHGAQGSVVLVYQRSQRRFLALKIVRLRGGEVDARGRLMAQRAFASGGPDPWVILPEASGLGRDAPEDIAAIVDGEKMVAGRSIPEGEWLWLLMPYVHGPNALELALGDEGFSWAEAAALCAQVAARLARRPEGQAHLDLKPENILIDLGGRAFLADQDSHAGTPGYAAPEQRQDGGKPDARADLFALGRSCQRLLARVSPKPGDPPDMVPPWPGLPEDMPPERRRFARELMDLVRELCSPDPAERGDVQEVARRFLDIATGLGGPDLAGTLKASIARSRLPDRLELFAKSMASQPKAAELMLSPSGRARPVPWPVVMAVLGVLFGSVAYHEGWVGTTSAQATLAPEPVSVGEADPLGSDAFGPDHYTAEITELGPGMHAGKNHGYVRVHKVARVLAVSIRRTDDSVVWRAEYPEGNHRFDIAPGKYIFMQERENFQDPKARPNVDRQPFTVIGGDKFVFDTDPAPTFAPH